MFIPRMWFDEVERIGKQRCTPTGYAIQGVGDLTGFVGLLTLLGVPLYLAYAGLDGSFRWPLLWLLAVPVVLGVVGAVIVSVSWSLAYRKRFNYDYKRRVSSWVEGGQERTYTFDDWQAEQTHRAQ
jgi:hypothetical protein